MSLSQRLQNSNTKSEFIMSSQETEKYEAQIRQLKLLSKSQTALLKAYIHEKLRDADAMVNDAISCLSNTSNYDPRIKELRSALLKLNVQELEVDVNSVQIPLSEELSKLRAHLDGGISSTISSTLPPPIPVPSPVGVPQEVLDERNNAISALKAENSKVRELLREAQMQLTNQTTQLATQAAQLASHSVQSSSTAATSSTEIATSKKEIVELSKQLEQANAIIDANAVSINSLRKEAETNEVLLEKLKKELETKSELLSNCQRDLEARDSKILSQTKEIESLKQLSAEGKSANQAFVSQIEEIKKHLSESESARQKEQKDSEQKLASKLKELNEAAEAKLKEFQSRSNQEKEEMEIAMAQELEELEKSKETETKKLQQQIDERDKKLSGLRYANKTLTTNVRAMRGQVQQIREQHNKTSSFAKTEMRELVQSIKSQYSATLVAKLRSVNDETRAVTKKYMKEMQERKRLHNLVQELKGNIRVYMRCRPPTSKEIEGFGNDALCVSFPGEGEVRVFNEKNREKVWEFDEVFDTSTSQEQVYSDVSALVTSVLDGYNVCIFAYGQTGSGKTFTMMGPPDDRGVNTRALEELFTKTRDRAETGEWSDTIHVSILEVYNEEIRDLLSDGRSDEKLAVKIGENGNFVQGLIQVPVTDNESVLRLFAIADRNRATASTNMNEHSSRSHMMLTVTVVSEFFPTGAVTRGKLNLVDLAGSERLDKSGAQGQALKEAQNINKSLSALGDVIAARASKQAHIPFRNSTLTYLLQDSLSQDSKTLMIVCVSPVLYNAEETFCSLNFAARVRTVELGKAGKNIASAPAAASASAGPGRGAPVRRSSIAGSSFSR